MNGTRFGVRVQHRSLFQSVAYKNELIERAWFLSPVTDMERIIHNAINYCSITEKDFEEHQTITTPIETLYWKYYLYVKLHPIVSWKHPIYTLRGEKDAL